MIIDRLLSALWVPVAVVLVTAILIIGVGELLLALAHMKDTWMGVPEPIAVAVALIMAALILGICAWVARETPEDTI